MPLFERCCWCQGDGTECIFCDDRGFVPLERADLASIVDQIADVLEPMLKRSPTDIANVLADAKTRLVDLLEDD